MTGAIFIDSGYAAARDFVFRHWREFIDKSPQMIRDAKTMLQEWAQGQGYQLPHYETTERSGPDHAPHFSIAVKVAQLCPYAGRGRLQAPGGAGGGRAVFETRGRVAEKLTETRCGYVALLGAPNAGKSTLTNELVGGKVSIVSRKVQTTRFVIRGLLTHGKTQIIFVDTPGLFAPQKRLDRAMVKAAWDRAGDADYAALLIDAQRGFDDENLKIIERLKGRQGAETSYPE